MLVNWSDVYVRSMGFLPIKEMWALRSLSGFRLMGVMVIEFFHRFVLHGGLDLFPHGQN